MRRTSGWWGRRAVIAASALLLAVVSLVGVGQASAAEDEGVPPGALPAPYSGWNVTVEPIDPAQPQILHLSFDSPLLKRRMVNTVYLPDGYRRDGAATPVVYALHGTVLSPLDNCALDPVLGADTVARMLGCGGGYVQDNLSDIPSQLGAMRFAIVSPDTSPEYSVCQTCLWIDGRNDLLPNVKPVTAKTLPADSFLHRELYPLAEALFGFRSDRSGRGVMGFSMGGIAAALQGMIHPDDYSFIGYISGAYDVTEPDLNTTITEPLGYYRDQGYGTHLTDPVWWAQFNPKDIATNLRGVPMSFLLTSGSGCLNPVELTQKYCQGRFSPVSTPSGVFVETVLAHSRDIAVADLAAKNIPFTTKRTAGTHGANNADMFAQHVVPQANSTFAAPVAAPDVFSYRSALPDFSVWGYHFAAARQQDAFLELTEVDALGRRMVVAGPGRTTITTPPTFAPGETYRVRVEQAGRNADQEVRADANGRVTLTLSSTADPSTVTVS
ncbi:esterase family protein [Pseudonocardia kujensis]|uniref:alpha/beta hydrolase-fold protein n=1 Tax=Pseudonocardia kujensis TaxID=1128675 RepID=UPI001E444B0C|nr:alpha/beta hydrolase-fold protein [Pseudonocardia kujensis]MCE0764990.1 esterase family protein [Pseudonocardia kujensis]